MSFDPSTYGALKKEIADEISKIEIPTPTGDETLILKNVSNGGLLTLGILNLFSQGGGSSYLPCEFLDPIIEAFDGKNFVEIETGDSGYTIKCPVTAIRVSNGGTISQVSFTFMMDYSGKKKVTVILDGGIVAGTNVQVLVESGERSRFDLTTYPGDDGVSVCSALLALCFQGGGEVSVSGSVIELLNEGLNKSENTSILLDMGDGNPYELFPTFVQHCTGGKIFTFNLVAQMGEAISTFLIFLNCANRSDSIDITVHVS